MKFILRLFPEISIKSRPVRNKLIGLVRRNLINVARQHHFYIDAYAQWDKILADFGEGGEELRQLAVQELGRIPGIHSFMPIREFEFVSLDQLYTQIKDLCGPTIIGHTFAVRVRRRGSHEFNSQQAERILGGKFNADFAHKGVCLDNPEVTIRVEIESHKAYVTGAKISGMGGYPVGSQGEVYSLISGGFDSGVASYKAIHRGCRTNFLFFNMGGTAHELGVKQESYFLWQRYASSHKVRFTAVPFEDVVGQILERVHHGVRGVVLKRMMVRTGAVLAEKYGVDALVTGESLGQVSSQTLKNLSHIDKAADILILRPLITMDKQEIIDECRSIGTIGFAENMPEYCGVISDHPNVCPKLSFVEEEEAKLDPDLAQRAAATAVTTDIRTIPGDTSRLKEDVEIEEELKRGETVLDVRAPDEVEKHPLKLEGHEVIAMPFYRTAKEFSSLDQTRTYVLYCDQGVMSLMQARQLKELGHHNVKVWRPGANN